MRERGTVYACAAAKTWALQLCIRGRCGYYCLQAMAYTAEDVVGLLDADVSYVDSSDDDLGFEIEEYDTPYTHAESTHPQGK